MREELRRVLGITEVPWQEAWGEPAVPFRVLISDGENETIIELPCPIGPGPAMDFDLDGWLDYVGALIPEGWSPIRTARRLTRDEVAATRGVGISTIKAYIVRQQMPPPKGRKPFLWWSEDDIRAWQKTSGNQGHRSDLHGKAWEQD